MNADELVGRKNFETVAGGFEIIEQAYARNLEQAREGIAVNHPGQIRCAHGVVHHRSGHSKASGTASRMRLADVILNEIFDAGVLVAVEMLFGDGHELAVARVEGPEIRFRAAEIAGYDHERSW